MGREHFLGLILFLPSVKPAAGQVMGPVVVVLLLFKTFAQDLSWTRQRRQGTGKGMWESGVWRDPTPKKVLHAMSAPMSDRSWQGVKTFSGVGSPNIKGSNPEESFIREVSTYVWQVLATCQDFLRGWIPESQGIQPRRTFYTRSQHLCQTGLGAGQDFLRGWIHLRNPSETTAAGQWA